MEPNTAVTANSDPSAASEAGAVDDYGFPVAGDLSTDDMSDEALDAFVAQTLRKPGGRNEPRENPSSSQPATAGNPQATPPVDDAAATPGTVAAPAEPVQPETPAEPTPELAAIDIPDLDTSDLWIEVTNTDGELVRLSLDEGIPDEFMFANDKQLYEVMDAFHEMKDLKASRSDEIAKLEQDKEKQESDQQSTQTTMSNWANEIDDLVGAGLIPKSDATPADGKAFSATEIAADPGLKLTNDVFDYMKTENTKRATTGRAPLTSFAAAFTLYRNDSTVAANAEAAKQKALNVKRRGAIVGGTSAPAASEKGYVYKRGSARNIWAVDTSDI